MALLQKNTYSAGNTDLTNLFETVDMQRKGFVLEVDETNKQIESGAVMDINGGLYYTDSDTAITDSGESWASIGNSSIFYVRAVGGGTDEFQYSTSAPSFDSDKCGWYNGNERTIVKAYKDGSGNFTKTTLYKNLHEDSGAFFPGGLAVGTGAADSTIDFADDADIVWVEASDRFEISKDWRLDNGKKFVGSHYTFHTHGSDETSNDIFVDIQAMIPTNGDKIMVSGMVTKTEVGASSEMVASYAERISGTKITCYGCVTTTGVITSYDFDSGETFTKYDVSLCW